MSTERILAQLVAMSKRLGDPDLDYAILGEGNTSAVLDDGTFFVKASGTSLAKVDRSSFVRVDRARTLAILDVDDLTDEDVRVHLGSAKVGDEPGRPSVETPLHAIFLGLPEVGFVGHTHPTAVNALTCSRRFEEAIAGRIFPDEIVVLGLAPMVVPYVDPGVPLARETKRLLDAYLDRHGERPRWVLMENHGLIALGTSAQDVVNVTAMAVKTASILTGTFALGGPRFLSPEQVDRIHTRPDEHYRQQMLEGDESTRMLEGEET